MGTNRDPEIYDPTGKIFDEYFRYKWRKTWCTVVAVDALQASNLGRPLLLNRDNMDTKKQIQEFHIYDSSFYKDIPSSSSTFNIKKLHPLSSSIESNIFNILESLKNKFPRLSDTFKFLCKIPSKNDFISNVNDTYIG